MTFDEGAREEVEDVVCNQSVHGRPAILDFQEILPRSRHVELPQHSQWEAMGL